MISAMTTALFILLLLAVSYELGRYTRHDRFARPSSDDPSRLAPDGRHFVASLR
jgi:hypothetical protein